MFYSYVCHVYYVCFVVSETVANKHTVYKCVGTYLPYGYLLLNEQMLTRSHSNQKENPRSIEGEAKMSATKGWLTIEDIMKEIREGNKRTEDQLDDINKRVKENKKIMEDFMSKKDEKVGKLQTELGQAQGEITKLQATVKELEGAVIY